MGDDNSVARKFNIRLGRLDFIGLGDELASLTSTEQKQAPLMKKEFTEKELNQFLDNLPNTPANKNSQPGKSKSKSGY